jgi:hypothetical protein
MRKPISTFLAAAVLVTCAPYSHADTITQFIVSGTAFNISPMAPYLCPSGGTPCKFSGTLDVDVTAGKITSADINFPFLLPFDIVDSSGAAPPSDWELLVGDGPSGEILDMIFTTASTPSSLVGFDGGSLIVEGTAGGTIGDPYYTDLTGSITVPEPGSLVLMLAALCASGLFAMRRWTAFGNR